MLSRHDFFALTGASDDPCGHVWIDPDDMISYFMDVVTEEQAAECRHLCTELDREAKRAQRNHADGNSRFISGDCPMGEDDVCFWELQEDCNAPAPEEIAIEHAEQLLLTEMLQSLSDRDRGIVTSRFMDDAGYAEIGERYGVSPQSARTMCDRILKRLGKKYGKLFE